MYDSRLRALGLLFCVVVLVGCTATEETPRVVRADVAVPSYAPPSGAPDVCDALAGTTHLTDLPTIVGTLTTQPGDIGAGLDLTAAIDELEGVLHDLGGSSAFRPLRISLENFVATLREARDTPLTDALRTQMSIGLDDVGRRAQAVCDFPS